MKSVVYFAFVLLLLASCKRVREPQPVPEELTKLERLYRIRPDSVMKSYDLSNDSLTEFPDLSRYVISSLDLSHNLLDTIILERLPLGIERLNLSHNQFKGTLVVHERSIPSLKELTLSHNRLTLILVSESLCRMDLSYNDLSYINFEQRNMRYLNVSYNPRLSAEVRFHPEKIDTVISEGVANGKELEFTPSIIIPCF